MPLALLAVSLALGADPTAYPRPELIIEPNVLAERIDKVVILDARPAKAYEDGHIPSAIRVDVAEMSRAFNTEVDEKAWTKRLGDLGIDIATPVVVYGEDWRESARIW